MFGNGRNFFEISLFFHQQDKQIVFLHDSFRKMFLLKFTRAFALKKQLKFSLKLQGKCTVFTSFD